MKWIAGFGIGVLALVICILVAERAMKSAQEPEPQPQAVEQLEPQPTSDLTLGEKPHAMELKTDGSLLIKGIQISPEDQDLRKAVSILVQTIIKANEIESVNKELKNQNDMLVKSLNECLAKKKGTKKK